MKPIRKTSSPSIVVTPDEERWIAAAQEVLAGSHYAFQPSPAGRYAETIFRHLYVEYLRARGRA